jgi:ATP-binding cassette subfamily F protein 3
MRPDESAYDHLATLLPNLLPEALRTRLGGFGFGQDKAFVPVSSLSGGERARLNLALVTYDAPGLLILDEPTNHLDMETRESLVAALAEYSGAVVLVSHDWHLVELVADRLWLVEDGTVQAFDGDLDAYRRRLDSRQVTGDEPANRSGERAPRRLGRQEAVQHRQALEPLRRESQRAATAAARLAAEQQALDQKLAAPNGFTGAGVSLAEALKSAPISPDKSPRPRRNGWPPRRRSNAPRAGEPRLRIHCGFANKCRAICAAKGRRRAALRPIFLTAATTRRHNSSHGAVFCRPHLAQRPP